MTDRFNWNPSITWNDLSPRQQEIMLCLARGFSTQETANVLSIKLSTVRNNISVVYVMLGITNRVQALMWVLSHAELVEDILDTA